MPVLAGSKERVAENDIVEALAGASAFVYIQSHHVRATDCQPLETCIRLAHEQDVPVIVDAAAEEDLGRYVELGADLVCYSGGKALGGLSSSGFVAGRADLVEAVRAQDRGIGRPMKVAQEQILSIILAFEFYAGRPPESGSEVLEALASAVGEVAGIESEIVADEVRPSIRRLEIRHARAEALARALRAGEPPVFVRAHHAATGRFAFDVRNVGAADVPVMVAALAKAVRDVDAGSPGA